MSETPQAMLIICIAVQGVWEKDEIRKDDSFKSFEEVFEIAKQQVGAVQVGCKQCLLKTCIFQCLGWKRGSC